MNEHAKSSDTEFTRQGLKITATIMFKEINESLKAPASNKKIFKYLIRFEIQIELIEIKSTII